MYDAIFLATIVGFFALCVAYIKACDWIIGPDAEFELDLVAEPATASADAGRDRRWSGPRDEHAGGVGRRQLRGARLTLVVLVTYLVLVLVFPERF